MTIIKTSKWKSICLWRPHPTMTTKGALNRAVWMVAPRTWDNAKFIWLSHASSTAVKCSAAFSTSGTKIRPTKASETPVSRTASMCSTKPIAISVTRAIETASANIHSVKVSFAFLRSRCRSSSFSSSSRRMAS